MKIASPTATQGALVQSGLPSSRTLVRLLGVLELAVGVWAIASGTTMSSVAIAVLYLGFSAFVLNALVRKLPVASCGCFGKEDTPPSWIHVAVTALGFGAGVLAGVIPPSGAGSLLSELGSEAILFLAFVLLAVAFAYMSLTTLPKTLGVAKRP